MAKRKSDRDLTPHSFQILLALAVRDRHGLDIMRDVLDRTEGRMHLWPGMLYGSLQGLLEAGLVAERRPPRDERAGGGRPRYYGITARGRKACAEHAERLERYVRAARAAGVLDTGEPR